MIEYHDILTHASQLPIDGRLRLIDELASSVPDDHPPRLSPQWLAEINLRSDEIDTNSVKTEKWAVIRERLFDRHDD